MKTNTECNYLYLCVCV